MDVDYICQFLENNDDMFLKLHLINGDQIIVEALSDTPSVSGSLYVEKPEKVTINLDKLVWVESLKK